MRITLSSVIAAVIIATSSLMVSACGNDTQPTSPAQSAGPPVDSTERHAAHTYFRSEERSALFQPALNEIGISLASKMLTGEIPSSIRGARGTRDTPIAPAPRDGYGVLYSIPQASDDKDITRVSVMIWLSKGQVDLSKGVFELLIEKDQVVYILNYGLYESIAKGVLPTERFNTAFWHLINRAKDPASSDSLGTYYVDDPEVQSFNEPYDYGWSVVKYSGPLTNRPQERTVVNRQYIVEADAEFLAVLRTLNVTGSDWQK